MVSSLNIGNDIKVYSRKLNNLLAFFSILLLSNCTQGPTPTLLPAPTDTTFVKLDMEDGSHRDLKKYWFEAIHSCKETTNWRAVENQTQLERYEKYKTLHKSLNSSTSNVVIGNVLRGTWKEKGSVNQAGSILKTAYNKKDGYLYAISDGGSLWKGNLQNYSWEVVNQNLRFDGSFLDLVYPQDKIYRVIGSVGGIPHYKNATENTWHKASGISEDYVLSVKDQVKLKDGQDIFYLSQTDSDSKIQLRYSKDYGKTYSILQTFETTNMDDLALEVYEGSEDLYLIERKNFISARIWTFEKETNQLKVINESSSISFGNENLTNLELTKDSRGINLFCYDHQDRFLRSSNDGQTWEFIANLPTTPWDVGVHISTSDPNIVMMGAVEAYRSINGGRTWAKVNNWFDYYTNRSTNLHADIMDISEYETLDGNNIMVVANHGGVSSSFDKGEDFVNLGLEGLNISQYYSVRTYPHDNSYIFAGSQDQGLQRALDFDEGPANFSQFISGDFGHLQFTNFGRSLWAIYPGGWISYYPDPILGTLTAEFELRTNNKSVWLPPIITSPYNPNSILIAGGSLAGTSGSHIVELTVDDLSQFFASQWSYNFMAGNGEVSAMNFNPVRPNEFYVLTTNGKFYKSLDKGLNFQEKNEGLSGAHTMYGNTILTSKKDGNVVIIGGSGYDNPAVYISRNAGESFTPMHNGLPPTSVFEMVYDKEEKFIFAATEAGPYVYVINQGKWYDLAQDKAPNQRYWSVEFLEESQNIRFGTYGRGIWDLNLEFLSKTDKLTQQEDKISVSPNPSSGIFTLESKSLPSSGKITILNSQGQLVLIKDLNSGNDFTFDLTGFPNGLYYIIFDNEKIKLSNRIVKI